MKFLVSTVSILSIAGALAAQNAVSLETATDVAVFARAGTGAALKFAPMGTKVTALRLAATQGAAGARAKVSLAATLKRVPRGARAVIAESGQAGLRGSGKASAGTSNSKDVKKFAQGPHSFLMKIAVKAGTKMRVLVEFRGRVSAKGAKSEAAVDVNGDDKPDFRAIADGKPHMKSFELTAGAKGLALGLTTSAVAEVSAQGSAGYGSMLAVTVSRADSAGRCAFRRFGTSCGPVLTGTERSSSRGTVVTFGTTKAHANALAIFLMGAVRTNVRIPRTRCFLYTRPLILFSRRTDAQGNARISFVVPKDFAGKVVTQDLILYLDGKRNVHAESTEGIELACKKAQ